MIITKNAIIIQDYDNLTAMQDTRVVSKIRGIRFDYIYCPENKLTELVDSEFYQKTLYPCLRTTIYHEGKVYKLSLDNVIISYRQQDIIR